MIQLFYILIFPGILFLTAAGFAAEYFDRKLYARMQNRIGPPWFQPFADFVKLVAKEESTPQDSDRLIFRLAPLCALASVVTAIFYIPLWKPSALFYFTGDLIVVLYLLTIPTITFFLGGWYSRSLYSMIGALRAVTQLFAYEIPLLLGILSPALLADTWSLSEMAAFYTRHPWYWPINLLGFGVSFVALLGKLEKMPFDIPEAETEIVAGSFTEYSGRFLAFFRLAVDIEMVVGASLLAAVFLPFGLSGLHPFVGFILYLAKVALIVALLSLARTVFARLRIDQMIMFCWRYLAPLALLQVIINLLLKGVLLHG